MEFILPGSHGRERNDNEEQSVYFVGVVEPGKESDALNCLSKAHFVSQNNTVTPEENEKNL